MNPKNLVEFRRRSDEKEANLFSGATCACQKTLLGLSVCPMGARNRPQAPFSEKALPFSKR